MSFDAERIGGKYKIVQRLGQGGMGAVFEAINEETGQPVAIKVLISVMGDDIKQMESRFEREARATGITKSKHIVEVLEAGRDEATGNLYLAIELLHGEDLHKLLRRFKVLEPDLVLRIGAQTALGLSAAHDAGIIHRDIKPGNLMLNEDVDGNITVKILDFGVAKMKMEHVQLGSGDLTRTGSMLGSPNYMSPEQARGLKTIDHRADIWSLGVVMYKALTGKTPHTQGEGGLGELLVSLCVTAPPPLQDAAPWVPASVAAVVHKALRMTPGERFQSAHEMYQAIRALLPNGHEIQRSMLVEMSEEIRDAVATRMMETPDSASGNPNLMLPAAITIPDAVPSTSRVSLHSGETQAPMQLPARPEPRGPSRALIAGLFAVAGLGGALGVRAMQPSTTPVSASAAPAAEAEVELRIPDDATTAEVDGQPQAPSQGKLRIKGPLGSTRAIRLSDGTREVKADVAITRQGPLPAQLSFPPAPVATAPAPPAASASSAAQASAAPTAASSPDRRTNKKQTPPPGPSPRPPQVKGVATTFQ